jgi:hypothetical protein
LYNFGLGFPGLSISVAAGNTVVDLSAGFGEAPGTDTITVVGVTNLTATDFVFVR